MNLKKIFDGLKKSNTQEMTKQDILKYLVLLNDKLRIRNKRGEISMVGGAVMCLCFESRISTLDVDALFEPQYDIHQCAEEIAKEFNLPTNWLNDGVSVYLSKQGKYKTYDIMSNLKIYTATPEYMLAMKCLSARFSNKNEKDDVLFLINYLKIKSLQGVYDIITQYYPIENYKDKLNFFLKEVFNE